MHSLSLSIIVPVYQVEKYIRSCLESIFGQGLNDEDFEVIIVNDGTKDRSMEIIQDIVSQHKNVTIINQENKGLSVARNVGIATAKGEYILMPDSDDLLVDNSLKPLLNKAIETQADLVVADFVIMNDLEINTMPRPFSIRSLPDFVEKTGRQMLLQDLDPYHCFVWRTLYRRLFLLHNSISFVPGIRYQDVPFTHECYIRAGKCLKSPILLNIYRRGHESATSTFDINRARDYSVAIAKTWELTLLPSLSQADLKKLKDDIYTSFSSMLRHTCHRIKEPSERIKIIDFLKQEIPNLRFDYGKKQFISYIFRKSPHTFIRLYYVYIVIIENILLPFYYHHIK